MIRLPGRGGDAAPDILAVMSGAAPETGDPTSRPSPSVGPGELTVLVFSDDSSVRQRIGAALGRRVASDLPPLRLVEAATAWAVMDHLKRGGIDLVCLDGEAVPVGGLGVCRTIKEEVHDSPPVLVILGRPQDDWLAAWSLADDVAMHPIDPLALSSAVERVIRNHVIARTAGDIALRG